MNPENALQALVEIVSERITSIETHNLKFSANMTKNVANQAFKVLSDFIKDNTKKVVAEAELKKQGG
jgi:hypothetical protein